MFTRNYFLFVFILNHLIHTPFQEIGVIIIPVFTDEEIKSQSLNNKTGLSSRKCLSHNLDPGSAVPAASLLATVLHCLLKTKD